MTRPRFQAETPYIPNPKTVKGLPAFAHTRLPGSYHSPDLDKNTIIMRFVLVVSKPKASPKPSYQLLLFV